MDIERILGWKMEEQRKANAVRRRGTIITPQWNVSFNKLRMELSQRLEFAENRNTETLQDRNTQLVTCNT